MSERFVKIYEPLLHDRFLCENRDLFALFVALIIKAQFKDYKTDKGIIPRGSCILTQKWLADTFRVDRRTIGRWLDKLEKTDYISTKIIKGQNAVTVVTIRNYNRYQDQHGTSSGTSNGTSNSTSNGTSSGTTYKKDKEGNRKHYNDIEPDVVNSTDYFGEDSSDLRSSERVLRSRDLWNHVLTRWKTNEYEATNEKLFKDYWCKISEQEQMDIVNLLGAMNTKPLSKVWKKPLFESGSFTEAGIKAAWETANDNPSEFINYDKNYDKKYLDVINKPKKIWKPQQ